MQHFTHHTVLLNAVCPALSPYSTWGFAVSWTIEQKKHQVFASRIVVIQADNLCRLVSSLLNAIFSSPPFAYLNTIFHKTSRRSCCLYDFQDKWCIDDLPGLKQLACLLFSDSFCKEPYYFWHIVFLRFDRPWQYGLCDLFVHDWCQL